MHELVNVLLLVKIESLCKYFVEPYFVVIIRELSNDFLS